MPEIPPPPKASDDRVSENQHPAWADTPTVGSVRHSFSRWSARRRGGAGRSSTSPSKGHWTARPGHTAAGSREPALTRKSLLEHRTRPHSQTLDSWVLCPAVLFMPGCPWIALKQWTCFHCFVFVGREVWDLNPRIISAHRFFPEIRVEVKQFPVKFYFWHFLFYPEIKFILCFFLRWNQRNQQYCFLPHHDTGVGLQLPNAPERRTPPFMASLSVESSLHNAIRNIVVLNEFTNHQHMHKSHCESSTFYFCWFAFKRESFFIIAYTFHLFSNGSLKSNAIFQIQKLPPRPAKHTALD